MSGRYRGDRYLHPKPRSTKQWARDIDANRAEAAVALDAVLSGRPDLATALNFAWLKRLAIEDYRLHAEGAKPKRIRAPWLFRPRTWAKHYHSFTRRGDMNRGDVFCLFCCEPLERDVRQHSVLGVIDYGPRVAGHTTPCALSHLAGQRTFAAWGSVKWPDDMIAESA